MPDRRAVRGAAAVALLVPLALLTACGQQGRQATSGDAGSGSSAEPGSSSPAAPGTADLGAILVRALTEEHAAQASYDAVVATLGEVAPFDRIATAEAQHVAALERVARAHGVDVATVTAPGSPSPALHLTPPSEPAGTPARPGSHRPSWAMASTAMVAASTTTGSWSGATSTP